MPRKSRINKLPGGAYSERIRARLWVVGADEQNYLGVGKVRLMELIDELGSISQAAKSLGMSYKRAWSLVEELNRIGASPFVSKEVGGAGGGHAELTDAGREAIREYRQLEDELTEFLASRSAAISI